MIKVDSKETIHGLAKRFLQINRNRNIVAIIAIIITSILFTSIFTASLSVIKSTMESEMRKAMDKSHGSVEELTREQYEKISKDDEIKKMGLSIFLTLAENSKLNTIQTEIRYADKNAADSFLCLPTVGSMPKENNEIATSTIVLDALGIPYKLGENIHLIYTLDHKKISRDFKLSGYWRGDSVAMSQMVWVSKEYCDSAALKATKATIEKGNYEGDYNLSIWYSNILNLDQKFQNLAKKYGLEHSNVKCSSNPAYNIFDTDAFPYETIAIILVIILLSGYLIIYNVFNISVYTDIRKYGLLKNIGTTGRQLKRIVRGQALWLSIIGIPIGMILGFLIGKTMTPFLLSDLRDNAKNTVQASISVHPAIFIASALFSLATVYAGCLRPCHMVERLSPIEAVRMTDGKNRRKIKKGTNVTAFSMAVSNIKRNWHKSVAVVISLALSMMVLNMVYMIVNGFSFNSYTSGMISGDVELNGNTSSRNNANLHIITPKVKMDLEGNKDIASAGYIYFTSSTHKVDNILYHNIKHLIKQEGIDNFYQQQQEEIKDCLHKRVVKSHVIGINEAAFHKLDFGKETCTWEDFASGKYVITMLLSTDASNFFYTTGDKVRVEFNDKKSNDYKVITNANLPYTLDFMYYDGCITQTFLLPEKEYVKETGDNNAMSAVIDARKGKLKNISEWANRYNIKKGNIFNINSRYDVKKEFESFVNKYYMIGGMLTVVLFIIAVLNFFNTSATSILSRKKELSLLEVVGMTKKQIRIMLSLEGFLYLMLSFILVLTAGTVVTKNLVNMSVGKVYFFQCRVSVLPSILVLPVLLILIFAVPIYNYHKMCTETVVERIRNEE